MKNKKLKYDVSQTRFLSQAMQLEENKNPKIVRATIYMVSLTVAGFLTWAGFANINEVARAPGEVIPQGYQQLVQHYEGGIINGIFVQEGDMVEQGTSLVLLDGEMLKEDLAKALSRQKNLKMQEERLRAFAEGRDVSFHAIDDQTADDQFAFFETMRQARMAEQQVINQQIVQKEKAINTLNSELGSLKNNRSISQALYEKQQALFDKGYLSEIKLMEARQNMGDMNGRIETLKNRIAEAETMLREYKSRIASLSVGQKDRAYQKLDEVINEIEQNASLINQIKNQMTRLNVTSPVKGLVKGVAVNTVGGVVSPGQTLMEIVPLDKPLEVQVKISPKDIGHLKPGQNVKIKFSSYDFSRYGSADGILNEISATTFSGENSERFYRGRVSLTDRYIGGNAANPVLPGMTVMTDIITGEKTILQYLLKPIQVAINTAFQER